MKIVMPFAINSAAVDRSAERSTECFSRNLFELKWRGGRKKSQNIQQQQKSIIIYIFIYFKGDLKDFFVAHFTVNMSAFR